MIILREKQFAKDGKPAGGSEGGEVFTKEQLEKKTKEAYQNGKNDAFKEVEAKAESAKKRARRKAKFKEYTGLDDVEAWANKKKEAGKQWLKGHKSLVRKGFKYGAIGVVATGIGVGGYKIGKNIYQKKKAEKKSEDIRKKVRGYDSSKKKNS